MRLERTVYKNLPLILGGGLAVVALNLVLYFTAVSRLDHFAKTVKATVAENRTKIAEMVARDKDVTAGVEDVKTDRQVVGDLTGKVLLTKGQRLVEVQKALLSFANARNLKLDSFSYGYSLFPGDDRAAWGHRYLKVSIGLAVTGPYQELKGFLQDIQDSPQFLIVSDMNLNTSSQGSALIQGTFTVDTYFVATEQDVKDQEQKGGKKA